MTPLLRVAFRNLLRAKRRNLLSGGTMALGSAALVLGSGLSDGIARQLTSKLVAVQTGHVQAVVRADDFVPQNSPFDAYGDERIPEAERLAQTLEQQEGVLRAVPYLKGRGTAIAGNRSTLATIVGIRPDLEPELVGAHPIVEGTFLKADDPLGAYIAGPLARKLRLSIGDSLTFVVQTPQGAVNSLDAVVTGIFAKGAPWFDGNVYVPLSSAQALYDWPRSATNVKVMLRDGSVAEAKRTREVLRPLLAPSAAVAEGHSLKLETYDESGRFSFAIIQANQVALAILSGFLFLAAAVGIVNAMLMSVHERTREIGTIRALGLRRRTVVRMFVLEGFALGLVAAAIGVTVGGAAVLHLGARGITMNTMTLAWIAGGDELYPVLRAWSVIRAVLAITALSTLAAVYPAITASRLEPREALHHV